MKRLSELGPKECGVIERVNTPEEVLSLVQMGCCIGSKVEVRHVSPSNGPMAICTCGRTLAVRKEAAAHLWVRNGCLTPPKWGDTNQAKHRVGDPRHAAQQLVAACPSAQGQLLSSDRTMATVLKHCMANM